MGGEGILNYEIHGDLEQPDLKYLGAATNLFIFQNQAEPEVCNFSLPALFAKRYPRALEI